ncbi:hypothetical protein RND71_017019 [Anisodus tanguticus]|uniref:(S)-2-hydroxy-acid oxidase n=1 Tax=Anisodus tanguticus TaxID=243964 RepID=A0AAE1V9L4_9SOLA|nr:hypothetical protein RND71_017019 [Anisodus tanguticus]
MATEPVNVNEFEELARQALPKMYFDFCAGGAEDQYTLEENIEAFRRIVIDMSIIILGHKTLAPIIVAPTSSHQLAHPQGEVATARGAAACNVIMGLAFTSTCTVEEVASSCKAVRFIQTFAEADIKNKMITPPFKNFEGLISTEVVSVKSSNVEAYAAETLDPSFCWKVQDLKLNISIRAIEAGVAGIIVSNHGARQLDYAPPTISVLEEVVHAVQGKVPVLLDGGIRRGTDIFKALALGAKAVLIGRLVIYGLAAKGESGVKQVIEMLKSELELTMALAGCCTVDDITRSHIKTEKRVQQPARAMVNSSSLFSISITCFTPDSPLAARP